MDKYEAELQIAIEKATYIPSILQWKIPSFRVIGIAQGTHGRKYYYRDDEEGVYYCESDFDREMRAIIRRNKRKRFAKK